MGVGASFTPEFSEASVIPTDHFWTGRKNHQVRWIVIHGTAGSSRAADVGAYFQTNEPATSAHYVVGLQGEVVQCVREEDTAWGNGVVTNGADPWWSPNDNPNYSTISIEHVKPDTSNEVWLTDAQKAASFRLVSYLVGKYNILPQAATANGGIAAHRDIDPVNKIRCPGGYPWGELFDYLQTPLVNQYQGKITLLIQQLNDADKQLDAAHQAVVVAQEAQKAAEDALSGAELKAADDLKAAQAQAASDIQAVKSEFNKLVEAIHLVTNATPFA